MSTYSVTVSGTTFSVSVAQLAEAEIDQKVADAQAATSDALAYKTDAEDARDQSQAARDTAEDHKLAAESAATDATNTASSLAGFDLEAIATTKTETAVDVFVYDTSRDSDGGAWRKRTQGTSWYNETLNTSTRGSRREFPAVAVIVAESDKVTIYDGDDPALPMWMVFSEVAGGFISTTDSATAVVMLNGLLARSDNRGTAIGYGLATASFIEDKMKMVSDQSINSTVASVGIEGRSTWNFYASGVAHSQRLTNGYANDVAMTVLPDAPIDPATGLPVPTILVGTDGNGTYSTSIITDSGTVYDIASDSTGTAVSVAFDGVSAVVTRSDGTVYVWDDAGDIAADGASPDATYSASSTPALLGTVSEVAA